jgi:NAD-dependent deacetylase sirtuin 2
LFPGSFKPTPCHHFIKLLSEKGLMLRNYTQNIDMLERIANVPQDLLVEAHGSFHMARCVGYSKKIIPGKPNVGTEAVEEYFKKINLSDADDGSREETSANSYESIESTTNSRSFQPLDAAMADPETVIDIDRMDKGEVISQNSIDINRINIESSNNLPPILDAEDSQSVDSDHLYEHIAGCEKLYEIDEFKMSLDTSTPICSDCQGYIKPDIVFFGEQLPRRFHDLKKSDFSTCDALIVIGTSLKVEPFCHLIDRVGKKVPRLLINREIAGVSEFFPEIGFDFSGEHQKYFRDAHYLGTCDDGVLQLCKLMGWEDDLKRLSNPI